MEITLEQVNASLEEIKRKLEAIELKKGKGTVGKTDNEIKAMADDPIREANQVIEQAARAGIFQESHFTALIEMYEAAEERLGKVTIKTDDSQKDAKQNVINKIKARTETFRGQKAKLDEATKKLDINAVEQEMQQELDSVVEQAEADIVMEEALKKLYSKLPAGGWEDLQDQYEIYKSAMENKGKIERNPEAIIQDMPEDYGEDDWEVWGELEKLDRLELEQTEAKNSADILSPEDEDRLAEEIRMEEEKKINGVDENDIDLFVNLNNDPQLTEKRIKFKNSQATKERVSELEVEIGNTKERITRKRERLYIEDRKNAAQLAIADAKEKMDAYINNMKVVLAHSKKREFPEGFVSAMENFLGEDGSRDYTKIIQELSMEKREATIVANKANIAAKSKVVRNLKVAAKLPSRTVRNERRTTTESESSRNSDRGAQNPATPPKKMSTTLTPEEQEEITMRDPEKHLTLTKMSLKQKKEKTYQDLKKAAGKENKKFCPLLWIKSRTKGAVARWEKQYETVKVEQTSPEQRQEAEQLRDSVYTTFRQQLLCQVVLEPSVETQVAGEKIKSVAKNAADKQVEAEKEKLEGGR